VINCFDCEQIRGGESAMTEEGLGKNLSNILCVPQIVPQGNWSLSIRKMLRQTLSAHGYTSHDMAETIANSECFRNPPIFDALAWPHLRTSSVQESCIALFALPSGLLVDAGTIIHFVLIGVIPESAQLFFVQVFDHIRILVGDPVGQKALLAAPTSEEMLTLLLQDIQSILVSYM